MAREPIEQSSLSGEQQRTLELVSRASLRDDFNRYLRERGIPLQVYHLEMSAEPVPAGKPGEHLMPPPGGCYCCSDGACYCC